jgi:hypothetical protein
MNECRRCSECPNSSHHWMEDFGAYDAEVGEGPVPGDFGCKHCEQRGVECADCNGTGVELYDDRDGTEDCPTCKGEGVIPL